MKTKIIFAIRCNPTKTIRKFEKISGSGTAYITELIGNQVDKSDRNHIVDLKGGKWTRIKDSEIQSEASKGKDILYKTASLSGRHRVYSSS